MFRLLLGFVALGSVDDVFVKLGNQVNDVEGYSCKESNRGQRQIGELRLWRWKVCHYDYERYSHILNAGLDAHCFDLFPWQPGEAGDRHGYCVAGPRHHRSSQKVVPLHQLEGVPFGVEYKGEKAGDKDEGEGLGDFEHASSETREFECEAEADQTRHDYDHKLGDQQVERDLDLGVEHEAASKSVDP